jgi:hypothetical protein
MVYGAVELDGSPLAAGKSVEVRRDGAPLGSYSMGSNPAARSFYVVRVRLENPADGIPVSAGAEVGEQLDLFVEGTDSGANVTVVARAQDQRQDLDTCADDTDCDGLLNLAELVEGTDPEDPDSDDDGLLDGEEVNEHATDPNNPDSDGDGFSDGQEVFAGSDPNDPLSTPLDVPALGPFGIAGLILALLGVTIRSRRRMR